VVPFEACVRFSYSPSIVTMAVSVAVFEIFIVKEWHDLEMAPFDRPHATFYWSAIVNITKISFITRPKSVRLDVINTRPT